MSNTVFVDGGIIFPMAARAAGTFTCEDVRFSQSVRPPFAINVITDVDLELHIDHYVAGVLYPDFMIVSVPALESPKSIQIFYALRGFQVRIIAAAPSNFVAEIITLKRS